MQISKAHEWTVRIAALPVALVVPWAIGLHGIAILLIGWFSWPFLIIPVWKLSTAVVRPVVIPESPKFTTLDLGGK
ncbi:MAG TPA: hypothetical protein VGS27_17490 [Candidatus Sulfotelmatobacter sp.]|nr:hypothetical protein [Candidatus Sulfotelmatobacter sp.]